MEHIINDPTKSVSDASDLLLEYENFRNRHQQNQEMESLDYEAIENPLTHRYWFSKTTWVFISLRRIFYYSFTLLVLPRTQCSTLVSNSRYWSLRRVSCLLCGFQHAYDYWIEICFCRNFIPSMWWVLLVAFYFSYNDEYYPCSQYVLCLIAIWECHFLFLSFFLLYNLCSCE